jgi:hypothetical protein
VLGSISLFFFANGNKQKWCSSFRSLIYEINFLT